MTAKKAPVKPEPVRLPELPGWIRIALFVILVEGGIALFIWFLLSVAN